VPITFEPPTLKTEFVAAIRALHDFAEITLSEWAQMHESDFDFEDTLDLVIAPNTLFEFDVGGRDLAEASVAELISLADELPKSKVVDHKMYIAPSRAFVHVEATNDAASQLVGHIEIYGAETTRRFESSAGDITFALVNGYTPFAIQMMKLGEYHHDEYPTFHKCDMFIEVCYPTGTKETVWLPLLPSFLFELDERTGMAFSPARRGTYEELWPDEYDAENYLKHLGERRLRPLVTGPGVESLLRLYERAIGRENDPEQHFVGFVKVVEHVSATVVNIERNTQVRKRLLSPRALLPDAGFVRDLVQLVESQRLFKKDSEALRLTIDTCCDPVELARHAPPSQKALASLKELSSSADRKKAMDAFSATLSATRNMFSHAKANYMLTGEECPDAELPQLTACARLTAQQCVRWFALSDVSLRIVD
jgi:hypothetical protein